MISSLAVVETAQIGADVRIGEFVVVRPGARLGSGIVLHPHVVIEDGVDIGDNVEVFPGAYLGKQPRGAGATSRTGRVGGRLVIAGGCVVGPHATVYQDVSIGSGTLIGDGCWIREGTRIGSAWVVGTHAMVAYNVTIGDRTKIMNLSNVAGNSVLGADVFIGVGVSMANDNALGNLEYSDDRVVGPVIENGAAVGSGAVILPGVRIGSGAVVAAGAVVTRSVPSLTLVMGVPARYVRRLGPNA